MVPLTEIPECQTADLTSIRNTPLVPKSTVADISQGGIVVTGYVVPGCVQDGTWMLWENSSAVVAFVTLACSFLDNFSDKLSLKVVFHGKLTFENSCYFQGRFFPAHIQYDLTRHEELFSFISMWDQSELI